MKKAVVILIILICSNYIGATEQVPDQLYYNGNKITLHTGWGHPSPLQTYYSQNDLIYPFRVLSTANYRGHIAIWEIIDDNLYLKEIQVRDSLFTPEKYGVKSENDTSNRNNSVFADWFSGVIAGRKDKDSYYFYVRYGEIKEAQTISEKDYKKIQNISEKDTSNHELMRKYSMLFLNENYISYYYRLHESDEISFNNKTGRFKNKRRNSPLLEFYSNDHMQFPYNWENFEKSGAPNCKWSVTENKIYLEKVQLYSGLGFFEIEKDSVSLNSLFDDNVSNNKVFANWLNGAYLIEYGEEKEDDWGFKESSPTEYDFLKIKDGVIHESYTVPGDFNFRDISAETEPGLKKIIDELR